MATPNPPETLKKQLGLFDVFAISTGAMVSSGFFLLPGLAAAQTGPSVVLAYLLAGLLVLPATLSQAELATAMPRAGGTYYFLDRSLGPLVGAVGGMGTWLALVFKSAFALIGIGAYLAIFADVPIRPLAILLTVLFAGINIVGAKETGGLQRGLVVVLLSVLVFFALEGLWEVATLEEGAVGGQFSPFLPLGLGGLFSTVGFVFVSYAGLTKVASVAEEVKDPDRNLPLGMILSLVVATLVYVVGVFIMVAVLDPVALREDLTPVATAAQAFFTWLPEPTGVLLIVAAAFAAFASTGNAGILSASRYPLAMARDRLVPDAFARIGRFDTPTRGILVTAVAMILFLATLDVAEVAKLASAFNLLIFGLLNLAVIVMRESRIESYVPGYRSPAYPWLQISGVLIPMWLIAEMGWLSILFTAGMAGLAIVVYFAYARERVTRDGAIYHVFERLGQRRFEGLDVELRQILKEKGARDTDPFEEVVAEAEVIDFPEGAEFEEVVRRASFELAKNLPCEEDYLIDRFMRGTRMGATPVSHGAALPHLRVREVSAPKLLIARSAPGIRMSADISDERVRMTPAAESAHARADGDPAPSVHAIFFLVSPLEDPGQHLHILAELARHVDADDFLERWLEADNEQELKEVTLREDRFFSLRLRRGTPSEEFIGHAVREAPIPRATLITLVRREGEMLVPRGDTELREGDRLTIIGNREDIRELYERYRS